MTSDQAAAPTVPFDHRSAEYAYAHLTGATVMLNAGRVLFG
jgi:hypothetical protein